MSRFSEIAETLAVELIRKSGVQDWKDEQTQLGIATASAAMASHILYLEGLEMANEVLKKAGTQILFADHAGDFSAAAKTDMEVGTPTDVQLSLASLADGSGRESAKVDLGATRAEAYSVMAALEFAATPTAGEVVEFYWAPSPISTAANGNPMQIDGADAAAPSGIGTLAELVDVCQFIGNFVNTNDATGNVQVGFVGTLVPTERYGILIVKNESGAALHSDDVEMHVAFTPIVSEIQ